jgi:PAS domain-containing protein
VSASMKTMARRLSDPVLLAPIIQSSVERAVARSGESLALAIGERIAAVLDERLASERLASQPAPTPQPPASSPEPPPSPVAPEGEGLLASTISPGFPVAVIAVDERLEVRAWNGAAESLWAAPAAERVGKSLDALDFFGLEGEIRARARRALQGSQEPAVRLSFDRDRVFHIQLTVLPVAGGGGALIVVEDTTEKVENDISAKVLGQYQRALSASLPVPLVVVDPENRITSWNAAAEALLGIPERDVLGKQFSSLPATAVPRAGFPFCTPDGVARGTLFLYGKEAIAFQRPEKSEKSTVDSSQSTVAVASSA